MERDGLDEGRTRELEAADDPAPYIDTSTDFGGDTPTAEIVPNGALLVADSTPTRANPVSAYLAGLAESSRRPMRTNLETIARLPWEVPRRRSGANLARAILHSMRTCALAAPETLAERSLGASPWCLARSPVTELVEQLRDLALRPQPAQESVI